MTSGAVTVHDAAAADDVAIGLIAATGLAGARSIDAIDGLTDEGWSALLAGVVEERLTGLLVDAVEHGDVGLRDDRYDELLVAHEAAMVATLRLESFLVVVCELLRGARLDVRVLKGPSSAHLDYHRPEQRSFADVDVLVRGEQFDAVAECLTGVGMRRRFDEPRPGFTARFGKGVCFTAPNGLELDVHRALTSGPFAVSGNVDALWRRSAVITVAGSDVECLEREERVVAAAVHAVLGNASPRWVPLRDVAQILQHGVDTDVLVGVARELGVESVVARAVLLARARLALDEPLPCEAWALAYRPTARDRRMLRAYVGEERSYAAQMFAGARAVKGLRARAAYVRALAFPSRGYLDSRDATYTHRARRAARLAAKAGSGER